MVTKAAKPKIKSAVMTRSLPDTRASVACNEPICCDFGRRERARTIAPSIHDPTYERLCLAANFRLSSAP